MPFRKERNDKEKGSGDPFLGNVTKAKDLFVNSGWVTAVKDSGCGNNCPRKKGEKEGRK